MPSPTLLLGQRVLQNGGENKKTTPTKQGILGDDADLYLICTVVTTPYKPSAWLENDEHRDAIKQKPEEATFLVN